MTPVLTIPSPVSRLHGLVLSLLAGLVLSPRLPAAEGPPPVITIPATSNILSTLRPEHPRLLATKADFMSRMSHSMRSPLNAILGMLRLLHRTELTPRQLDYASKTEVAAKSLLGLLNDILDSAKMDADKMTLDPQPFELDRMLRDLSVILSTNIGGKPVELLFDIDPALPAMFVGDAMRLQQVLINLLKNAEESGPDGIEVSLVVDVPKLPESPGSVVPSPWFESLAAPVLVVVGVVGVPVAVVPGSGSSQPVGSRSDMVSQPAVPNARMIASVAIARGRAYVLVMP